MEYLYDHEGTRVEKSTNGLTTFYPSPYFTQTSTGTSTTLVMLGNENIATIQDGTVLWNHTDHLGSTVATTNLQGNTVEQTKYSAFGHQISRSTFQNTSQTEKYTGHTYDAETDLLYAQARYYRGSLGRFLSQDPVFWELNLTNDGKQVLLNPQAQNSYSYGLNNPIRYTDPTGRCPQCVVIGIAGLIGAGGGMMFQGIQDYQSGTTPTMENYTYAAGKGVAVTIGALVSGGAAAGVGLGTAGTLVTGSVGAGLTSAGVDKYIGNSLLDKNISSENIRNDAVGTIIGGIFGSAILGKQVGRPATKIISQITSKATQKNIGKEIVQNAPGLILNTYSSSLGSKTYNAVTANSTQQFIDGGFIKSLNTNSK